MEVALHPVSLVFSDAAVEQAYNESQALSCSHSDKTTVRVILACNIGGAIAICRHTQLVSTAGALAVSYTASNIALATLVLREGSAFYSTYRIPVLVTWQMLTYLFGLLGMPVWNKSPSQFDTFSQAVKHLMMRAGVANLLFHCFTFRLLFKNQLWTQTTFLLMNILGPTQQSCSAVLQTASGRAVVQKLWEAIRNACHGSSSLGRPSILGHQWLKVDDATSQCCSCLLFLQMALGWALPLCLLYLMERSARVYYLRTVAMRQLAVLFVTPWVQRLVTVLSVYGVMGAVVAVWEGVVVLMA